MSEDIERRDDANEAGRKGGAGAMAVTMPAQPVARTAVAFWSADTIRWGPAWSGVLVAIGTYLVLLSIGLGSAFAGYKLSNPNYATDVSTFIAIWNLGSLIISGFIGGMVAGRTAALEGMRAGWYEGTIVWALALIFSTLISGFFIFGLAGGLGSFASAAATTVAPGTTAPPTTASLVSAARSAATIISYASWIYLIGAVLTWVAAALGGALGARGHVQTAADETL